MFYRVKTGQSKFRVPQYISQSKLCLSYLYLNASYSSDKQLQIFGLVTLLISSSTANALSSGSFEIHDLVLYFKPKSERLCKCYRKLLLMNSTLLSLKTTYNAKIKIRIIFSVSVTNSSFIRRRGLRP